MKARFRCDNCGHHVPLEHDACPHCGKLFTAVLCPVCSFEGEASLFRNGCPSCGYKGDRPRPVALAAPVAEKPLKRPLPSWFYLWSSIVLLAVLALLIFVLLRLR